ncbi:MAG: hypothetical protein ACT4PZ_02140 [Panacagrimonas sp.]
MKRYAALWLATFAVAVHAEPVVTAKEYLKNSYGAVRYTVKCDSGAESVVQCAKSGQRCGKSELGLEEEIRRSCGAKPGAPPR